MSPQQDSSADEQPRIPGELPVLPLRDMVVFPFIIAPLSVAPRSAATSKLEIDELASAKLATKHEGVEASRVEDAADVPGRARDHVEVFADVLDDLPSYIQAHLENVAVLVDEGANSKLLGLYEGVNRLERSSGYHLAMPDRITLFWKPIVEEARSSDTAAESLPPLEFRSRRPRLVGSRSAIASTRPRSRDLRPTEWPRPRSMT